MERFDELAFLYNSLAIIPATTTIPFFVTFIVQLPYAPLLAVAFIVTVPGFFALISPELLTVATLVLLELQVTLLLEAFTIAVSGKVLPTLRVRFLCEIITETAFTVTIQVSYLLLSQVERAVIVAMPTPVPLIKPLLPTVATLGLLLDHTMPTSVAFDGKTFATFPKIQHQYHFDH